MGGGILPVAVYKRQVYFLFGKEHRFSNNPGWSDFGGGRENQESYLTTAIREGTEEINGFLGTQNQVKQMVKDNQLAILECRGYRTYVFQMDYDPNLPFYFNNNYKLMEKNLPEVARAHNGMFEKSEIRWVSSKDLDELPFREFYKKTIVAELMKQLPAIKRKALA